MTDTGWNAIASNSNVYYLSRTLNDLAILARMMLMFHETRGTLRVTQTAYRSRRKTGSTLHDPRITFRDSR